MPKKSKHPGIRKRGKSYQVEIRVTGQPAALRKTFSKLKDAQAWQRAELVKLDQGHDITTETLGWLIKEFQKKRDTNTYQDNVLQWWADRLGRKRLSDLRKKEFTLARAALQDVDKDRGEGKLAPATINRRVAAISAVLQFGIDELHLLENNPAHIKALKEDNERDRLLTDLERERLLAACRDFTTGKDQRPEPALYMLVRLAMITGARAGELLSLRWEDVNLEKGYVIFRNTKNGDTRPAPVRGEVLDLLKQWHQDYRLKFAGFVLGNTRTGTVPYNSRAHWKAAKEQAHIQDFRFHDLRHQTASELAMAGVPLNKIGELLGHRSAQMTKRYSHYSVDSILELGDILVGREQTKEVKG